MELSELTAYAEEKYHIQQQFKWAEFPGCSVLAEPETGKFVAMLMRQWDTDSGTEIQRCDIKCGQACLREFFVPCLTRPFRMKGADWVGVIMDAGTEASLVFQLFDRAVAAERQRGYTVVLENRAEKIGGAYRDTVISLSRTQVDPSVSDVPAQIQKMRALYEYGGESFALKCKNFYRQGKFMEDYEDDAPWDGELRRYYITYHDLNLRQLRGYFTWRTQVRKGNWRPISVSLAFLYVYELLCGIGCRDEAEGLQKLREFVDRFIRPGYDGGEMGSFLRHWMLEYAVLHDLPPEDARAAADPALMERDAALAVLREPEVHTDRAIFAALCCIAGKKLAESSVVAKEAARGTHLFASVWRHAVQNTDTSFERFFGRQVDFPWHPLEFAIYWEETPDRDRVYTLNPCREFRRQNGFWAERKYEKLYYDQERFQGLLHEADRQLRLYLKTGRALREKPEEAWAKPIVEAVIAEDREAMRPKISIDLTGLEQIRQNARLTRDSLLIEEEIEQAPEPVAVPESAPLPSPAGSVCGLDETHTAILQMLVRGEDAGAFLRAHFLLPAVVTDTINEALFDEIGDSALECDGSAIRVIEDYRAELAGILGGTDR